MTHILLPCLALVMTAACTGNASPTPPTANTGDTAGVREMIAADMAAIRLKAAEARIADLEQRVGIMENKPEKLDLQLLTQRIEQMEARIYSRTEDPASQDTPIPATRSGQRATPPSSPDGAAARLAPVDR